MIRTVHRTNTQSHTAAFILCTLFLLVLFATETIHSTSARVKSTQATIVQKEEHHLLNYMLASQKLSWTHFFQLRERRVFSQNNEDGVLEYLFDNIGTTNKYYVEFGVEGATECNTRHLYERYGWDGLLLDGTGKTPEGDKRVIRNHFITAEGIVGLFQTYNVPTDFDLLSVDIDRNDYYVLREILNAGYRPRAVVVEINRNFGPNDAFTVAYKADETWHGDPYFGCSPLAWVYLLDSFGFSSVYMETKGVNQFFISRTALIEFLSTTHGIAGITETMIKNMLPTFTEQYRRSPVIHTTDWKTFMNRHMFPNEWLRVLPNLTFVPATQSEKEAMRTA